MIQNAIEPEAAIPPQVLALALCVLLALLARDLAADSGEVRQHNLSSSARHGDVEQPLVLFQPIGHF